MRKEFLDGTYTEKEVVLTIRVPKDFDHDDERMLDDEIAALLFKQGWELVNSKEYRDLTPEQEQAPVFVVPISYENLSITAASADPELDENGIPVSDTVWICVYRDTLGFGDDNDNLTNILVPTDWLISQLKEEGQPIAGWFDEYTADSTDRIASSALLQGKILDCSHSGIKAALLQQPEWFFSLEQIDQDCVAQYAFLLGRPLVSEEEYKELDALVNEMILDWETPEAFFDAYPDLRKCTAVWGREHATPNVKEDEKFPLENYDAAVSHLCEVLNRHDEEMDVDDVRAPVKTEDFIPIFKSTNYFGVYCYHADHYYSGESEYYLVDRNNGTHKMVLGDSFEFIGQNLLDCMKDEEILHVANTEWLQYLVDFSLNNVQGIVPLEELGGIAVLQTALRAEKTRANYAYYPKPSLSDQIGAANRKTTTAAEPVVSVAHFADNREVKGAVLQSDALRKQILDVCHQIPGYKDMPHEDKNRLYDLVKKSVSLSQAKGHNTAPER